MKEILSTITSKGQITLPAEIRRLLGVGLNDKVAFVIDTEGTVHLDAPKYRTVASLRGAAGTLKEPKPWEEMRVVAREERLETKLAREHE